MDDDVDHHDASANPFMQLHDFIDDPNFECDDHLIRGEKEDMFGCFDHDHDDLMINGFSVDYNGQFGFDNTGCTMVSDLNFFLDEENDGDGSSGTSMANPNGRKTKTTDRSKTLISERRRRGRMKDKLYQLRALVPNITKMDKASIVGDAVLYVQTLQGKAKKLKAEITSLESSSTANPETHQEQSHENSKRNRVLCCGGGGGGSLIINPSVLKMDAFQVEERSFYLRLVVCSKGGGSGGVAVSSSLYKALESLTGFHVQSSNLTTVSAERLLFTFTLNVRDCEAGIMSLENLKLWVSGALLNQGFEVLALLSA